MAFTCRHIHQFEKDTYTNHFKKTKNYLVNIKGQSSTTNDDNYVMKICLFNKELRLLREIPFKYYCIEDILVKPDHDLLAIVCPEHNRVIIINLETERQEEIILPPSLNSIYDGESDLYPSPLYWWENDLYIVSNIDNQLYRIDNKRLTAKVINLQELKKENINFYTFLKKALTYTGIKNAVPHSSQFTYYNGEEIGFVDIKNNKKYTALYLNNDIHEIFFFNNAFIVISCYVIEWVTKQGIRIVYNLAKESHKEFRHSIFFPVMQQLITIDRYWYGATQYNTISQFDFDDHVNIYTQREKDQYKVLKYLKNNLSDTTAWLRLILMEEYNDDRLSGRWFDALRFYDKENIYADLISAHTFIHGSIYNNFRLMSHDNTEIMAFIEFAKSKYLKKRGDLRKYEQVLLKSIEYCSQHTNNLAALGEFYIQQGRTTEGKQLIQRAIRNITVIYTDNNRILYDRYDINEFLNEHYRGTHTTQETYNRLNALL